MGVMSLIVISIIILILILKRRYEKSFIEYVSLMDHLPSLPKGFFYSILNGLFWITIFFGSSFFTLIYPWWSISIWILLLIFIPPFGAYFSHYKKVRQMISFAFSLYIFLTISHLSYLNQIRDEIGTQFSAEYTVEYEKVWVGGRTIDGDDDYWQEDKPIFKNSNQKLNFFWETLFPAIYVYGIFALMFISFNVYIFFKRNAKGN
jgi:hypothetical protein